MARALTPEAQEDFSALLDALMPFAEQMLEKHGEFFPFGATVSTAGEVGGQATYDGDETPASEEVIASLIKAFRQEARGRKIRAAGICYDGRIVQDGKKVDAVFVGLEHARGSASKTCVPYTKGKSGKVRFGEMIVTPGESRIFVTT